MYIYIHFSYLTCGVRTFESLVQSACTGIFQLRVVFTVGGFLSPIPPKACLWTNGIFFLDLGIWIWLFSVIRLCCCRCWSPRACFYVETVSVITFACVGYSEEIILLSLKENGVRDYFVVKYLDIVSYFRCCFKGFSLSCILCHCRVKWRLWLVID